MLAHSSLQCLLLLVTVFPSNAVLCLQENPADHVSSFKGFPVGVLSSYRADWGVMSPEYKSQHYRRLTILRQVTKQLCASDFPSCELGITHIYLMCGLAVKVLGWNLRDRRSYSLLHCRLPVTLGKSLSLSAPQVPMGMWEIIESPYLMGVL